MVIYPSIVKIPKEWNLKRDLVQPKVNYPLSTFGLSFDETYDYDTLFSGVIRYGENTVIITAPPFLNFKHLLNEEIVTYSEDKQIKFTFYDLDRCSVAVGEIGEDTTHLRLSYNNFSLDIPIENNNIEINKDKKLLFTMIKNDPKEWIINWVNYHTTICGIDKVVIFNNNSNTYSSEELEEFLNFESIDVNVVDWTLPWGVNGPPWDSDFCKIVALQYLKYKFAIDSTCVLNLDIDEFFVSEYELDEIIESMIIQKLDTINFESKNISRYTNNDSSLLNSYYYYHKLDVDGNKMIKWITLPKFSKDYSWSTHFVFSPNSESTNDFYYAHLSILTAKHHLDNNTEVADQRNVIRDNNKKDLVLKRNFELLTPLKI